MLIDIFNYFKGFLRIEVKGFSVERFINLATYNGIYFWDMERNNDAVTIKVTVKGFKLLKKYARKTGCKIKILNKVGLPFKIYRYKKRKIFVAGLLFFIVSLYFLSSFVWMITIAGNQRLSSKQLLDFCKSKNLKVASFKHNLDIRSLEKDILENFTEVSWVNIKIKGTCVIISIKETIPKQEIIDRTTPCNVIAKKNGLILSVTSSSGTPVVKPKDVVKQGDVLVSGQVTIENNNSLINEPTVEYVHAKAEVKAKTYYRMNFKIPYEYIYKKYTGKTKKSYVIDLFGKKINLFSHVKFTNYVKLSGMKQLHFGKMYSLPIKFFVNEYKQFVPIRKKRSLDCAKLLADKIVTNRIIREFDFETDICDKSFRFESDGKFLYVKTLISVIERIDKQVELE